METATLKPLVSFHVQHGDLFNNKESYLHYQIHGDKKRNGFVIMKDEQRQKQFIIRQNLREIAQDLFAGRKNALQIAGYGREHHYKAIDRLNSSLRTIESITDHYGFLSYIINVVIPDLYELTPGQNSPFKNYLPRLNSLRDHASFYLKETIEIMKKEQNK